MLIGSYLGIIGEKRRTAIPKKFLEELGKDLILAKWYEDCLLMVPKGFWEKILSRLTGDAAVVNLGVRDIERFILGSAYEAEPDSQGRIIIPEILAEYAKLGKEVIFLGLVDRVEIWSKNIWDEKAKVLSLETKDYIEKLSKERR